MAQKDAELASLVGWFDFPLSIWLGAAVLFFLLIGVGAVAALLQSRRTDLVGRLLKVMLSIVILWLVLLPPLVMAAGVEPGRGVGLYVPLLALFLYYLGRALGREHGKRHMVELLGLDSASAIEETQDRLFESRMRLQSRTEVVKSIGELAEKERQVKLEREQRRSME